MKHKDVTLDFTSLLDIVLIILFFFILYSAFHVQEAEAQMDDRRAAYEQKLSDLEKEKAALREDEAALREQWQHLLALDENAAGNQQALLAFNEGRMLSFNLQKRDDGDDWRLSVTRKQSAGGEEETVDEILPADDLSQAISAVFDKAGFAPDDVLIVTFTYDGNVIGTHRLYLEIMKAFRAVQAERENVYLTAINISK